MHPAATRLLATAGLPYLKPMRLTRSLDPRTLPQLVYVRSLSEVPAPGLLSRDDLWKLIEAPRAPDYLVVPFISSIAGAAALSTDNYILVELVDGHLSGLLQQGAIALRSLFRVNRNTIYPLANDSIQQEQYVHPDTMVASTNITGPRHSDLHTLAEKIAHTIHGSDLPNQILSEIMVTDTGDSVWVDAKPYPWQVWPERLYSQKVEHVYWDARVPQPSSLETYAPARWSPTCVQDDMSAFRLSLGSRPLTCHFVTYSLAHGLGAIYNR